MARTLKPSRVLRWLLVSGAVPAPRFSGAAPRFGDIRKLEAFADLFCEHEELLLRFKLASLIVTEAVTHSSMIFLFPVLPDRIGSLHQHPTRGLSETPVLRVEKVSDTRKEPQIIPK